MRRGHGAEGLVVGHDGLGDGDHAEQEDESADEEDGAGEACGDLYKDGADSVVPLQAEGVEPVGGAAGLLVRDGEAELHAEVGGGL